MSAGTSNKLQSAIYNALARSVWMDEHRYSSRVWQLLWRKSCRIFSGTVCTTIHGRPALLNYGHTYPIYARRNRSLNGPLIELVAQCYALGGAPISLVDVGANIGDTILLLSANCPHMIRAAYCVEGESEFFAYLRHNLSSFAYVRLFRAMLSSSEEPSKTLRRTNAGTASAQGEQLVHAQTLDSLLLDPGIDHVDVLKSDVDGFDGRVLAGSRGILERDRPAVLFEWHPALCRNTANDWTQHFSVLGECGYDRFVWFTKYGTWSHFTTDDQHSLDLLADLCLRSQVYGDWHYDVIALHKHSPLEPMALAELRFAKARRSPF